MRARHAFDAAVLLVLVLGAARRAYATEVPTIYDNDHMFPIGSRAAGMGGAYTALACDEAALHYNPAALGCAGSSRLELSANAYILQAVDLPNAFGKGQDISAINFHSIPSIVGGVRVLSDGDPDTGAGRWVFGLSVEVPHSLVLKVDPANPDKPNSYTMNVVDNLTTGDIGIGWQVNQYLALGLSVGAAMRTYQGRYDTLLVARQPVPCGIGEAVACFEFIQSSEVEEALSVGGRAKLGLRLTPTKRLSLGLAASSPSLDVYGSSKLVEQFSGVISDAAGNEEFGPLPSRLEGSSNLSLPLRLALGVAYQWSRVALSLDVSLNFPHVVGQAYDLQQTEIAGITTLTSAEVKDSKVELDRTWQPNVNLGAEFGVADEVVIDVGGFTDLSSVSALDMEEYSSDHVNMFGGTLALGLLGKQARGWFGLSFEIGMADSQVFGGSLDLDTAYSSGLDFNATSTITRWTLAGFIGSNYSFLHEPENDKKATTAKPAAPPAGGAGAKPH